MKKTFKNLTFQVIVAIIAGIVAGMVFPSIAGTSKVISSTFINMINMIIAPIIFCTVVLGIAKMGDMKKVGRVGGKALLYFELITTLALVIGMVLANIFQPGQGVKPSVNIVPTQALADNLATKINWVDFIVHIIPHNIFDAFAKGDILQILFFAILFGYGISKMDQAGLPLIATLDRISKVLFNMMGFIMKLAPIGAFGGMAYTVGNFGLAILLPMSKLIFLVYLTCFLFIFVILNLICYYYKFSLWKYLKYIRQEILVVFGTSSSESVLPSMMLKLEKLGCSNSVVGLVIPTGYSFNLDGTAIYLSMSLLFLVQVFHIDMNIWQQATALGILMITSKGAAGVTGSGFIVLGSTLVALKIMPIENVAILLGVDRFLSMARSMTNLIGNGIATIIISKSENEFDEKVYQRVTTQGYVEIPVQVEVMIPENKEKKVLESFR